jgi:hypothetical protein
MSIETQQKILTWFNSEQFRTFLRENGNRTIYVRNSGTYGEIETPVTCMQLIAKGLVNELWAHQWSMLEEFVEEELNGHR